MGRGDVKPLSVFSLNLSVRSLILFAQLAQDKIIKEHFLNRSVDNKINSYYLLFKKAKNAAFFFLSKMLIFNKIIENILFVVKFLYHAIIFIQE